MRNVRIAVCIPFHRDVTLRWAIDLRRIQIPYDHFFVITSHYQIDQSREELARDALESNATHALFVDTDVRFATDSLLTAMSHHYPLIGGLYWSKRGNPAAWVKTDTGYQPLDIPNRVWVFADYCGFGFTLIDCRVFKHISKPFFVYERADDVVSIKLEDADKVLQALQEIKCDREERHEGQHSEDSYFFRKVRREMGIRPIVDGRIELLHEELTQFWPDGSVEYLRSVREPLSMDIDARKVIGR